MPIQADDSFVADSTLSTSPQREEAHSPSIKRATRTYGRKKSLAPQNDMSTSPSTSELPAHHSNVFRTAPANATECIPSTSDNEDVSDVSGTPQQSTKFQYAWQKGLLDIDHMFEDDDAQTPSRQSPDPALKEKASGFGEPSLLLEVNDKGPATPSIDRGVFPSSIDCSPAAQSNPERSPREHTSKRRAKSRKVIDSDESGAEEPSTSPPVNTSPPAVPSFTPGSRQSSTPPTSDSGMPTARFGQVKLKGKSKSSINTRRSVPPLEFTGSPAPSALPHRRKDDQSKKTKKVTKQDRVERIKTSARLAEDRQVGVPRADTHSMHSKEAFWTGIGGSRHTLPRAFEPASDPIHSFSSPETRPMSPGIPIQIAPSPLSQAVAGPSKQVLPDLPAYPNSDSEENLPSTVDLLNDVQKSSEAATRKEELRKLKLKALSKQLTSMPDDDDDLEVELPTKDNAAVQKLEVVHSKITKPMTSGRKTQLHLAGISTVPKASTCKKAKKQPPSRDQFNKELFDIARRNAATISKQKEEEWKAIGGTLREPVKVTEGPEAIVHKLAVRGLEAAEASRDQENRMYGEDDDGSDDDDWNPEGQESGDEPEPTALEEDEEVSGSEDEDVVMTDDLQREASGEEADEENFKVRSNRRRRVIGSDDEDEENDENASPPQSQQRRLLASVASSRLGDDDLRINVVQDILSPSTDEHNEDGTDKENDVGLMFDRSDDKENKAVVRFASSGFDDSGSSSGLRLQRDLTLSLLDSSELRRPFQEIPGSSDTPKALDLDRGNLTEMFEAQLRDAERIPEALPIPSLQPLISTDASANDADGFSQFSESDRTLLGRSTSSNGDFSNLFGTTTQKHTGTWLLKDVGLREAFVQKSLPGSALHQGLSKSDILDLTQDVVGNRPFEIQETQARKADAVFEKEQEYMLGAAFEPNTMKEKLYVNDYGFLTQTRPNVEDPEVYEPRSPIQVQSQHRNISLATPLGKQSFERSPLATLSLADTTQTDSPGLLKRLRKRSVSPSERSASIEKKRPNAFEILYDGSKRAERQKRRKLDPREFAVAEAEESDDEGGFWGNKKGDDDEEDGEDLDRTLETLVDDQQMDDETLGEHLVREKFKEDEALADKKNEEEAHAIVEGRRRTRKKNGDFMSDGSGDESDDDEDKQRRRRLAKQRKKREDVEALENNPQTKSFADAYKRSLIDDDAEFDHLKSDDTQAVLDQFTVHSAEADGDNQEDELMDDEEGDTQPAAMGISEFNRIIQERRAKHGHLMSEDDLEDAIDLNDTTWVDFMGEKDEYAGIFKTVKTAVKKPSIPAQRELDPSALDDAFDDGNLIPNTKRVEGRHQQGQWAKRESRNRNTATARSVGAAAVTGLARAKTGGGSLRQLTKSTSTSSGTAAKATVKKSESILISKLGDRSSRFTT